MYEEFSDGITRPVKLKIKPKECNICGKKYVPTSRNQKYCPDCRSSMTHKKLTEERMRKAKEHAFGQGPWSAKETPESKMQRETPEKSFVYEHDRHEMQEPGAQKCTIILNGEELFEVTVSAKALRFLGINELNPFGGKNDKA